MSPMSIGLDTDIETGEPLEVSQIAKQAQQQERRARQLDQYQALLADLAGQGGEIAKMVAEQLAIRVQILINADGEARTLQEILHKIGSKVQAGERLTEETLAKIMPQGA